MKWNLPKQNLSMPSSLYGQTNGNLQPHLLTKIGVGSAEMERTAARSFVAMFAEARRLGFNIKQVGDYRSFQEQLSLFLSRYEPVSFAVYSVTKSSNRKKWDDAGKFGHSSKFWRKRQNPNGSFPATAATPGSSNHGWGLALDIAEEYDADTAPDPIRATFVNWLIGNASRYGISAELDSEPWHWRYVAGDNIPKATLEFENASGVGVEQKPLPPSGGGLVFLYPGEPLKQGSSGIAVKLVQAVVGAKPDGDFGPATHRRVVAWQVAKGLRADGVVEATTWGAMFG